MTASSLGGRALSWSKTFGLMLAAVVIALLIREQYPFSHNPMYSKFDPRTYYLHVVDENDNILIFRQEFGFSAIRLKKVFNTKFKKIKAEAKSGNGPKDRKEQFRLAGEDTLRQYHRQRDPRVQNPTDYKILKLVRTDIELMPGTVAEEREVIAQIDVTKAEPLSATTPDA